MWEGNGDAGSPSKNTCYKNNLFVGDKMLVQRLVTVHTPQYNPNMWYTKQKSGTMFQWGKNGPYYDSFSAWQKATGEEAQGYYADPMVDAGFRLTVGSPAIDKGVRIPGINDTYAGSASDMGACEYGVVSVASVGPGGTGTGTTTSTTTPPPDVVDYAISGYVRDNASAAMPGVLVTLSGAISRSTLSDAGGFYQFANLQPGIYTVTASRTGYTFGPVNRTLLSFSSPKDNQDFIAMPAMLAQTLDGAVGYPNPWRAGSVFSPVMKFKNLTEATRIRIYTLDGELVKEINESGQAEVQWDVAGENVASGVYLCLMSNGRGEKKTQKLAIIR
jgi:hypothetical protein